MFRKIASVFGVLMLLLISFNTYSFAQAFTQEEIDQQMEETRILFEEAQEEMEQEGEAMEEELDQTIEEERERALETYEENQEMMLDSFNESEERVNEVFEEAEGMIEKGFKGVLVGGSIVLALVLLFVLFELAGVILNIVMLLDCLKRDFKDRTLWIVILIAGTLMGFGIIPGLMYYFLVKKKLSTTENKEKEE